MVGAIAAVVIAVFLFIFLFSLVALDDGWSPLKEWLEYKEKKLELDERQTELDIKRLKVAYHQGYITEREKQHFEEDFDVRE